MTLSTCNATGHLSSRVVLLKGVDARGFWFVTNYASAKGHDLTEHPQVALNFLWKTLRHQVQVRVEGVSKKLPAAESDAYFASRPRNSQLGAWASRQSQVLAHGRDEFEQRLQTFREKFADMEVPRPDHWGGVMVVPSRVEFWYGAEYRWHERINWGRHEDDTWHKELLYP